MARDKVDELYEALAADGIVTKGRDNFREYFFAPKEEGYRNRKALYDALKSDGLVESGSYEEFRDKLGLRVGKRTTSSGSNTPTTSKTASVPSSKRKETLSQSERDEMMRGVNALRSNVSAGQKRFENRMTYTKANSGIKMKPVRLGENSKVVETKPQYDVKSGEIKPTYVTESGNEFENRAQADLEQNAVDQYKSSMTVEGQLREAEAESERLDELMRARMEEIDRNEKRGGLLRMMADESHGMPGGLVNSNNMRDYRTDERYLQLEAAARKNRLAIQTLRDKREGKMNDFWHSLGTTMANGYTLTDGLSDMNDATAVMSAQKRIDAINKKRASGQPLTKEEEAAEAVLRNFAINEQIQGLYGGDYGAWSRAGSMAATSVDLMKDIMLTPGAGGIAKGIAAKTSQTLAKGVAKIAGEKVANNVITKGILKGTGILVGAHGAGAVVTNTAGIGHTAGAMGQEMAGNVTVDENGNYGIENQKGLLHAFADAERQQIGENGSEMFGEFIPGIGGVVKKGLDKIGLSKISNALTNIGKKDWYKQYSRLLSSGGYNGIPGEAIEEYEDMLFNAMTGNAIETWEQMKDPRTHIDIWLGTATMGALLGAVPMTIQGTHTAQYYRYKHKTDIADKVASYRITPEKWEPLREQIDMAENGNMADVVVDIIERNDLQYEEKKAALDYVRSLTKMRGYNIAEANNAGEEREVDVEIANNSYSDGYNTNDIEGMSDIKRRYDMLYQQIADIVDEDMLAQLEDDPVSALSFIRGNENWGEEERAKVIDYVNAKATYDGMMQGVTDDIENRIAQSDALIDSQTKKGANVVQRATMKIDDRPVHIIDGNVVLNEDGSISTKDSDESIIIRDDETGKVEFVAPTAILSVDGEQDAEELKAAARENINMIASQDAENKINGVLPMNPGDVVTINDGGGQTEITIVGPVIDEKSGMPIDGQVMVQFADGTQSAFSKNDIQQFANVAAMERLNEYNQEQKDIADAEATEEKVERREYKKDESIEFHDEDGNLVYGVITQEPNSDNGDVVWVDYYDNPERSGAPYRMNALKRDDFDRMIAAETEIPENPELMEEMETPELAEESEETLVEEPMPMVGEGEEAEPDFSQTTPQRAHTYIYNEAGLDRDEANQFVEANKKAADKTLSTVHGKKPKMGTSLAKYHKEMADWQQKVADAQLQADYWKQVEDEQKKIIDAEAQARAEREAIIQRQAAMEEQQRQEEELRKREEQAQLGSNNVAPQITEKWNAAPKVEGVRNEITLANGERVAGRYVLVESGAATPSHNPSAEFIKNDGFPMDEHGQSVNDRDYERDKDAQTVTRQIAGRYDSRALQTPVVVSNDGVVLSGNGRTMAGELAAQDNTDGAYIDHLKKYGSQFGFTTEQVESMAHPRVLFVPDETMPYTADTFAKFNQQEMKGQSKAEQAVKLGKIVDESTFGRIIKNINSYDTLGDFYADTTSAANAINELAKSGAISQAQYAEMFDGDTISAQGREILENMLIGKAFEGNPDAVREITAYKSVRQSVICALAEISNNLLLGEEYSLEGELAQAIDLVYQARQAGYKAGERVSGYARQLNLFPFDEGETVADYRNATTLMLADVLNDNRVTRLKKVLAVYNHQAQDSAGGQMDLFTGEVKSKEEILNTVKTLLENGTEEEQQSAVNAAVEQRKAASVQQDGVDGGRSGGSEDAGGNAAGQSDLAQTEVNAPLSDEVNEFDKPFVLSSDGTTTFGEVTEDSGLTAAPIKLSLGENRTDDSGADHGYGLLHIEAGHGGQIRAAGFASVEEFVETVAKNYDTIREGNAIANNQTYLLEVSDEHNNTLFIQLSRDGSYWNVNSAGIFRKKYSRRMRKVASLPTIENSSSTETVEVNRGQSNGATATSENSSLTFVGKDTKKSRNNNELDEENVEKEEKVAESRLSFQELRSKYPDRVLGEQRKDGSVTYHDGDALLVSKLLNRNFDGTELTLAKDEADRALRELIVNGHKAAIYGEEYNPKEMQASLTAAESETNTSPTDKQKEAGNYKKGHVRIDGFDISIENPKGSERKGTDASGKPWSVTMNNTYGYIRRTEGVDGDHIDVFLSDDLDGWNGTVYVVDQVNTDGSFDEHKVMYGFNSEEEARAAYLSNYSEGWQGLGAITGVTKDDFKKWVDSSHRKTKAFAEYKSVKAVEGNERNGEKLHKRSGVSDKNAAGSSAEVALRDALVDRLRESGIDVVTDMEEGQRVLDEANSKVQMQAKKRALETASLESDSRSLTVVPSADGAKVLKNLETTIHFFENSSTQPKTFIGYVAKALGAKRYNSRSEYATFETKNGRIVTIRLADHNAKVSNFDRRGELDGISIVVSPKRNAGIINDGDAHIVEYYYDAIRLRRAKSKPLADIVRSIQQALYSGEFTDTTGLGVRQEVNRNEETVREQRGYTQRDNGDNVSVNALAAEREGSFGRGLFSKHYGLGQGVFDVLRKLGVIVGDGWHHTGKNFKQTDYFAWHDSKRVGGDADYSDGSEPDGIYARYRENKKEVNAAVRRMLDKAPAFKKEVKRESFDAWASHVMPFSEDAYLTEQDKAERKKEHDRISGDISIPPRYRRESHNVVDQLYFNMAYENWKKATEPLRSDYDTYVKDVELKNEEIMKSNLETDGMEKEMMSVLELLGINDAYGVVMRDRMSDAGIVRYFRTASGEAYGFVKGGKIYIDPRIAKSDTPIHEYAHLWAEALRQRNAEEWRNVVELMKGTSVWEEVKSSYPELKTDDEIADEAIAKYSGKRGAERLRKAQEEVLKGDGDVMEKAATVSALERVKEALGLFWKGVADFLHIHYNSAEDVADRVLTDLLDGVNPEVEARKDRQLDRINDTNPMLDDYHTGIRSANDIRTLREAIQDAREEANGDWDELSAYPDVDNSVYENALESGEITVYSSKPITDGNFVTPSRMQAEEYAGGGKVYSKTVSIDDVAWITTDEGQMAAIGKDNVSEYPMRMQFVGENGAANMDNAESPEELTRAGTGLQSDEDVSMANDPWAKMWGKSFRTKEQKRAFAEHTRKNIERHIKELVEKLHLDNVEIVADASELSGKRAQAKGFYNKGTGKITIVLSNHSGIADIEQTLLHEAVAHYGLRQLFGKQFDTFLDNVYSSAGKGIRGKIAEMAAKNGWDFRTATEEYLASLAEDTNFEDMDASWWREIKRRFVEFLHDIGFTGYADFDMELSDNELRYILWRSYENLAEPGRYRSILGEAADVAMQNKLQVGNYAKVADEEMTKVAEDEDLFRPVSERDRIMARDEYERMVSSGRNQFIEAVQDSMMGLKSLYQSVLGKETHIEDVPGFENAYLYENRMSSTNAAEQSEYYVKYMKPLVAEINHIIKQSGAKRNSDIEEERRALTDYLMAKHGLERNSYMRTQAKQEGKDTERDFAGLTALTGIDDWQSAEAEAQRMVDEYEAEYNTDNLWEAVNNATKATLYKMYIGGILSKERYEEICDMYEYYVPLRGWDETTSEEVYGYMTSKNGPLGGSVMKQAKGRNSKADDPIATIAMMADDGIRQSNRNIMKQRFLNFVLNNPSDVVSVNDLWLKYDEVTDEWVPVFPDINKNDSPEDVERIVNQFEEDMQQLSEQNPDKYKRGNDASQIPYKVVRGNLKEHQILVKRNGRTYVLTINGNPRAAQALNGLTNPDVETGGVVGNFLKGAEYVNRQLSAFYTTRNPDFVAGNFLRDALYANCMTWVKESPRYALRFHRNFGRVNPAVMRYLLGKWENGMLSDSGIEGMFYLFMKNGGETGYTNVKDIKGHKKAVASELKSQNGGIGRKAWDSLGEQFDLLNRSVENCARFAAFLTSREMGRSIDRSIWDAKEVSVNFNKKGSGGKMLDATGQTFLGKAGAYLGGSGRLLYVFWNAGVQGMTNFGRNAVRHPVKASIGASALFALGYAIPLLAQMLGGGDDDDKNAYYNLPEYIRRSNICFRSGEQWITIPLPIEYRAIYGMGELACGVITGNERYSDTELAFYALSQVSQMMPLDVLEGGGGVSPFVPSLAKPFTEAYIMNKGWTGLPIYKDTPFNKTAPEWTKAYQSADQTLVGMARWLNEVSGGDDYKKGKIDINPAKIEYMLNGYFGGMFTFPMKIKKSVETMFGDRDFEWRNTPILNRVVKSGDERTANRKLQNEYFKYKKETEETGKLFRNYEKAGDEGIMKYAEKADFLYNSPDYLRYEIFEAFKPDMDYFKEELKTESNKEKRKEIEKEMYGVMRELVDNLNDPAKYIDSLRDAGVITQEEADKEKLKLK